MSSLAYLDSLITKKPIQPETIRIEPHDMYNQKRIKEQAMRFQEEWFSAESFACSGTFFDGSYIFMSELLLKHHTFMREV